MFGFLLSFIIAVSIWYIYSLLQRQKHFQSKGVIVPPYYPVLGHMYDLFFRNYKWQVHDEWYKEYKHKKMFGVYELAKPNLFITDPQLVKDVLVKDAEYFVNRRDVALNKTGKTADKIFSEMLSMLQGEKWKFLRSALTPTFSSGKMKAMFPLMADSAQRLVEYFEKTSHEQGSTRAEVGFVKFNLAVIATCVFGIEIPIEEKITDFEKAAQKLLGFGALDMVKSVLITVLPEAFLRMTPLKFARPEFDQFINIAKGTMSERKRTGTRRNDFVDLIMDLQKDIEVSKAGKYEISEEVAIAQLTLFLFAGFDTTTNSLSFAMFLLAQNQKAQDRLREELQKIVEQDGEFTYENIGDCVYLAATFNESQRLYGVGFFLERECTKEYMFSGTDVTISPGELLTVPNWSFAHDPEFWENPEEFKPERFLPENKDKLPEFSHYPFGAGPRSCIAMRFAQLEAKVALAYLVLNHRITHAPGKEELIFDSGSMNFRSTNHGIHVVCEKIVH